MAAYVATQTRALFGTHYNAGDVVNVTGLNGRAIDSAIRHGLIALAYDPMGGDTTEASARAAADTAEATARVAEATRATGAESAESTRAQAAEAASIVTAVGRSVALNFLIGA